MHQLTQEGQRIIDGIAGRRGVSSDAARHMLFAVVDGNGSMAQFNHPEFGGSGQWMRGGMIMLGDMFNNTLKARVDGLCCELADLVAAQPGLMQRGSFQSQQQGGGGQQQQSGGSFGGGMAQHAQGASLFVPGTGPHDWWPSELGPANATGSQNNVRYAYFAGARRLAIDVGGQVWVYDTLDHQIGGFSQQQGSGGSILLTSQYGTVNLSTLPVVLRDGVPVQEPAQPASAQPASAQQAPSAPAPAQSEQDIFKAIERLGELKDKGLLTNEEFGAKKAELLSRL
jgi:hypothetical protein